MRNKKKATNRPILKHTLTAASIAFFILIIVGAIQFNACKILGNARTNSNNNTIIELNHAWTYETENGIRFPTSLPNNLNLPLHTRKVTLRNRLPDTSIPGGGIRFKPMMSTIQIYIDGKLVESYGEIINPNHYIYKTASSTIFVPLKPEQYGKEIVMVLSSLFNTELGMLSAPLLGSHHDFILNDLIHNGTNIFLLIVILAFAILLIVFYTIFQTLHNKHLELVAFAFFTLLVALLYNTSNSLVWELFNFSASLPALNAWFFFIEDGFLPILGYLIFVMVAKDELCKKSYVSMGIHAGLYVLGAALQVTWLLSINYLRPLFMTLTLINYIFLFYSLRPWQSVDEITYYQWAVFTIIGAQLADYFKYLLAFLPLNTDFAIWLSLEVPFLFFLPFAVIVYMVLLSLALVFITRKDLGDIKNKAQRDLLTGAYNRATMETFVSAYIESCDEIAGFIVIDLNHFKSINDTLGHLYGDQVLIKVAQQLELYFGNNDIVARLGGDEFAIFCPNLLHASEIHIKSELALTVLEEIKIDTPLKHLSASVGYSVYPDCVGYNELYESSDQAMYRKKNEFHQLLV